MINELNEQSEFGCENGPVSETSTYGSQLKTTMALFSYLRPSGNVGCSALAGGLKQWCSVKDLWVIYVTAS